MKFFAATKLTKSFRRGSALLLALVLTIALFIMGLVFVSTTQIEKETVSRVDELQTLDTAVDTVVGQINNVLVNDLFGNDNKMLNGSGDSEMPAGKNDEFYDYPGPDDPWLASLEPMNYSANGTPGDPTDDWCVWRHITDLYGNFDGIGTNDHPCTAGVWYYSPEDRSITATAQWDSGNQQFSDRYRVNYTSGNYYFVGRIVGEYEGTETILDGDDWDNPSVPEAIWSWGAQADADGDGIADSRWVKVPNLTGPRGQSVYTAVRIIDNGGMININTAFRYPDSSIVINGSPEWDGSRLSHVNLEGIMASTESGTLGELQGRRYGTITTRPDLDDYANDEKYDDDVSQRVLNPLRIPGPPVQAYMPFDITDELELRNRFFLASQVESSCETIWPATCNPGPGQVGVELPYTIGDSLKNWYYKLKPDIDQSNWQAGDAVINFYNRRFFSTTYNFDRVIVPKPDKWWEDVLPNVMPTDLKTAWETWTDWNLSSDKWSYRPVCVNDYVPGNPDPRAVTIEQIAAAIWLGLPNNTIISSMPQFNGVTFASGNARDHLACQMAVNMVDYIDTDDDATDFNPGSGANHYYGYEYNGENPYISMIAVALYDGDTTTPPVTEETHYAVEIYNPGPQDIELGNFTLEAGANSYNLPAHTVTPHSSIVLVDSTTGNGFTLAEVAEIGDPCFAFKSNDSLKLIDKDSQVVHDYIDNIGTVVPTAHSQAINGVEQYEARRQNGPLVIDGGTDFKFPIWPEGLDTFSKVGSLTLYTGWTSANDVPIQLAGNNALFTTIGELFNVLSIGTMDIGGTCHTMPEFWEKMFTNDPCNVDNVAVGKIDVAETSFVDLTRYLTVFHPFSDSIDNDGNRKNDNPAGDGIDNDGDGTTDGGDAQEIFANYGENSELAVAGRININTAPWFVIAQLPWVTDPTATTDLDKSKLARAIVAYRDKTNLVPGVVDYSSATNGRSRGMADLTVPPTVLVREDMGFANIAELLNVTHDLAGNGAAAYEAWYDIRKYGRDEETASPGTPLNNNPVKSPAENPGPFYDEDKAANDLKERDVIFQRISNLVTVRSDVFTAYIMVRVGELGPQKRVIAIFDRSNVYKSGDTPKLVALHPVPDPK